MPFPTPSRAVISGINMCGGGVGVGGWEGVRGQHRAPPTFHRAAHDRDEMILHHAIVIIRQRPT